jgi:hypothetical protein
MTNENDEPPMKRDAQMATFDPPHSTQQLSNAPIPPAASRQPPRRRF